jgi:GT2 family glycosyltransferase
MMTSALFALGSYYPAAKALKLHGAHTNRQITLRATLSRANKIIWVDVLTRSTLTHRGASAHVLQILQTLRVLPISSKAWALQTRSWQSVEKLRKILVWKEEHFI